MTNNLETKIALIGLDKPEIETWISDQEEKPFRAGQLMKWLYEKRVRAFEEMTDLSKSLRSKLEQQTCVSPNQVVKMVKAHHGTTKFLIRLHDGEVIECVTIVQNSHLTACLSSQAGCNVGCPFCATGLSGFRRNLTAGEIIDQYLLMQQAIQEGQLAKWTPHDRIKKIVFMGMGEPLLNYQPLLKSIRILNQAIGIGIRNITISTSGVIPKIYRLMNEPVNYNLAISLHAVKKEVRDVLVPLNRKHPIPELLKAAQEYAEKTGRRITFEYTLLKDINDSSADAKALVNAIRGIHCHINLIAYNPVDSQYQAPPSHVVQAFRDSVHQAGFPVTLRHNHGQEKMAACGQLRLQPRSL